MCTIVVTVNTCDDDGDDNDEDDDGDDYDDVDEDANDDGNNKDNIVTRCLSLTCKIHQFKAILRDVHPLCTFFSTNFLSFT